MEAFLQSTDFWVGVSFVLFVTLAYIKGKDVFLNGLDNKINSIRKEINAAEAMRVEAQELLAQYQRKNREAEKQAEDIIVTAKSRVADMKKEAQASIKEDLKRREENLAQRITLMEEKAIADIQGHASRLTLAATREIIQNSMSAKENERLNKEAISALSSQTLH